MPACLSVEKGVLISRRGLCSRCLEMSESLACGGARAKVWRGLRQRREGNLAARMTSAQCRMEGFDSRDFSCRHYSRIGENRHLKSLSARACIEVRIPRRKIFGRDFGCRSTFNAAQCAAQYTSIHVDADSPSTNIYLRISAFRKSVWGHVEVSRQPPSLKAAKPGLSKSQ